jgi:hypothetical protein
MPRVTLVCRSLWIASPSCARGEMLFIRSGRRHTEPAWGGRVRRIGPRRSAACLAVFGVLTGCGGPSVPTAPSTSTSPQSQSQPASGPPGTQSSGAAIGLASLRGRIAFAASPYPGADIYVVNANGSGLRHLTVGSGTELDPTWSPDGSRIAYRYQASRDVSTTEIYAMNADGPGQHNLTRSPGNIDWGPAWSPDGRRIVWNSDPGAKGTFRAYLMDPGGDHVIEGVSSATAPRWDDRGRLRCPDLTSARRPAPPRWPGPTESP